MGHPTSIHRRPNETRKRQRTKHQCLQVEIRKSESKVHFSLVGIFANPIILSPSCTMVFFGKHYYIDMLAQYSDDTPCCECTGGGLVSAKVSAATAISSLPGMKGSGCLWDTMETCFSLVACEDCVCFCDSKPRKAWATFCRSTWYCCSNWLDHLEQRKPTSE
jgi:hypothetical protein